MIAPANAPSSYIDSSCSEDPSSVPALAELAAIMFAEGRRDAARQLVDRARRLDAENARLREVLETWKP